MDLLKRIRHRVAHWLQWNGGTVETWWEPDCCSPDSRLMVGFRCSCGELRHVHESPRPQLLSRQQVNDELDKALRD